MYLTCFSEHFKFIGDYVWVSDYFAPQKCHCGSTENNALFTTCPQKTAALNLILNIKYSQLSL